MALDSFPQESYKTKENSSCLEMNNYKKEIVSGLPKDIVKTRTKKTIWKQGKEMAGEELSSEKKKCHTSDGSYVGTYRQ